MRTALCRHRVRRFFQQVDLVMPEEQALEQQLAVLDVTTRASAATCEQASTSTRRIEQDTGAAPTVFTDLPAGALYEVLRHVQWSARSTCRAFRQHINAGRLALRLRWPADRDPDGEELSRLLSRLPQLARLGGDSSSGLLSLAGVRACAATLTSLCLDSCGELCDVADLAACTALRTLLLSNCGRVTDLAPLAACTSLHLLSLSDSAGVSDVAALSSCTSLRTLYLGGCTRITDIGPMSYCTGLLQLCLAGCRQLGDLSALSSCAALCDLDLRDCAAVSDVRPLAACVALQHLSLKGCVLVSDITPLAACRRLQKLSLDGCRALSDVACLVGCASLLDLDVRDCPGGAACDDALFAGGTATRRIRIMR